MSVVTETVWKNPTAEFLITWHTSCWPLSIDIKEPAMEKYCTDQTEVDAWKEEYAKWASQEGNKVEYNIWIPDGQGDLKLVESLWF